MKKILFVFLGISLLVASGAFAARTKGIVSPKIKTKTIEVEKIVKVPGQSVVIKNEVNMNVGACAEEYRYKTVSYCAGHNGCKEMSSIEALMEIDPLISAGCRELAYNSKLTAIEDGIAVHLRCLNANGLYDLNKGVCRFTVELRRGKKVKETAEVWEDIEYTCGKELFPMAAKNRRNAIIGGGVIGAGAGAVGGGLLFKNVFGEKKMLKDLFSKDPCNVSDEGKRKELVKKLRKDEITDYAAFVESLKTAGVSDPAGCADSFFRQSYIEGVYLKVSTYFQRIEDNMFAFKERVFFGVNKDNLGNEATEILDQLSETLTKEGVEKCVKISVYGYASAPGTTALNQNLSERRAKKVAGYLRNKGLTVSEIYPEGEQISPTTEYTYNRRADIALDLPAGCTPNSSNVSGGSAEFEEVEGKEATSEIIPIDGQNFVLDHAKFQTKENFAKGAMIGAPVGGLVGAGLGALFTKYKCYLSGTDELLAKWNKTFKISPPASLIPADSITTGTSSSYSASTSIETNVTQ
ncbi:MAG: OmpA family protein [Alphaproteobacteria bacterium]|nr:OmpA family protein [Alphaproteobacteria bacterium]MBN2779695.1 OmpA family protein [Alphaproteobacteria bacterium]